MLTQNALRILVTRGFGYPLPVGENLDSLPYNLLPLGLQKLSSLPPKEAFVIESQLIVKPD